ncbi:hypothetical protein NEAUS07_0848 [Nematocida ausubeli]|nr:hypothetical protein NEAUS07_0848 [Nematocida ausubeli]
MKLHLCLMQVLIAHQICASMGIHSIEKVLKAKLGPGFTLIHPEGPLSPLPAYISSRCGFVYNKRFFSPDINAWYELKEKKESEAGESKYIYTRQPDRDRVHSADKMPTSMQIGIENYHSVLLKMFPSPLGDLSIKTPRNNAFIAFLSDKEVSKHAYRILASLFLLSDGVNVPLTLSKTDKAATLTLKNLKNNTDHFSLNMTVPRLVAMNKGLIKEKHVFQNDAVFIFEYFLKVKDSTLVTDKEYSSSVSYNEFKQGQFLNSPKWLMQAYIFEYISTPENYIAFSMVVHEMLCEYLEAARSDQNMNIQHIDSIFYRYFISEEDAARQFDYIKIMKEIQGSKSEHNISPFSADVQVPSAQRTPIYIRAKKEFISETFNNSVEASLLGVFFCLLYCPNTESYSTHHILHASEELTNFFCKYDTPFKATGAAVYKDWSRVVSGLCNNYIVYTGANRNRLEPGIVNMLCVITTITGTFETEKKTLDYIIREINQEHPKEAIFKTLEKYATNLFRSLSVGESGTLLDDIGESNKRISCFSLGHAHDNSRSVKVSLEKLQIASIADERKDIYGTIVITYKDKKEKAGVILTSDTQDMKITNFPEFNQDWLSLSNKVNRLLWVTKLHRKKTFASCMVLHYLNQKMKKALPESDQTESLIKKITDTKEGTHAYLEKFLLMDTIQMPEHKLTLVYRMLLHKIGHSISQNDPIARFISNIIGSEFLDQTETLNKFISCITITGMNRQICPRINSVDDKVIEYDCCADMLKEGFKYCITANKPLSARVQFIKTALELGETHKDCEFLKIMASVSSKKQVQLLSFLTEKGKTIKHLVSIAEVLEAMQEKGESNPEISLSTSTFWAIWISIACQKDNLKRIIMDCFNQIPPYQDNIQVVSHNITREKGTGFYEKVAATMSGLEEALCKTQEDLTKYTILINIFGYEARGEIQTVDAPQDETQ